MLKSKDVFLSPLRLEDSKVLFDWINDRDLVIFNSPYKPVHEASHQSWFNSVANRTDLVIFAIRALKDQRLIGTCHLSGISPVHRSAELQIRLGGIDDRGHGFGTQAVRLLFDFGFKDLNLNRIYLHVFDFNKAAIRVYEKAGMKQEGLLKEAVFIDGKFCDMVCMAILRSDYENNRNPPA